MTKYWRAKCLKQPSVFDLYSCLACEAIMSYPQIIQLLDYSSTKDHAYRCPHCMALAAAALRAFVWEIE